MTATIVTPREAINPTVGGVSYGSKPLRVLVRSADSRQMLVHVPGQTAYINRMVGQRYQQGELQLLVIDERGLQQRGAGKRFEFNYRLNNRNLRRRDVLEAVAATFGQDAADALAFNHTVVVTP